MNSSRKKYLDNLIIIIIYCKTIKYFIKSDGGIWPYEVRQPIFLWCQFQRYKPADEEL